ncbi:MAG: hypothetical protein M3125_03100, partial [Gemmatimonadota bacterium]|nr:hypothetical protein [Gemmatimonadota bacterium]
IIALLTRLNQDGTTLVVVTHDEELAQAARRVVHMRDGVIVVEGTREAAMDVAVRLSDARGERTERWPLRALVAWLFVGRQCDEVRAILGRGEAMRDRVRATWTPVHLSAEELTAIERTFPEANPERPLDPSHARVTLVRRGGEELPLRPTDPRVVAAARVATYRWFDYGPWADVWEAPQDGGVVRFEMRRTGETPPWSVG